MRMSMKRTRKFNSISMSNLCERVRQQCASNWPLGRPTWDFWFALEERFGNEICHVDVFVRSLSVVVVQ